MSSRATMEEGMFGLSKWLGLWHYHYAQWGGQMLIVRLPFIQPPNLLLQHSLYTSQMLITHDCFHFFFHFVLIFCLFPSKVGLWKNVLRCPLAILRESAFQMALTIPKKMACMYKAIVDDMIRAFMQITKYCSKINGGSSCKGPN